MKHPDPKDFAWVPIGYGVCVLIAALGGLVMMFEDPVPVAGQMKVGMTIMAIGLVCVMGLFAAFLVAIARGKE